MKTTGLEIIRRLAIWGAERIIADCTEIELLLTSDDAGLPYFPTTRLHAQAAVDLALADHAVSAGQAIQIVAVLAPNDFDAKRIATSIESPASSLIGYDRTLGASKSTVDKGWLDVRCLGDEARGLALATRDVLHRLSRRPLQQQDGVHARPERR